MWSYERCKIRNNLKLIVHVLTVYRCYKICSLGHKIIRKQKRSFSCSLIITWHSASAMMVGVRFAWGRVARHFHLFSSLGVWSSYFYFNVISGWNWRQPWSPRWGSGKQGKHKITVDRMHFHYTFEQNNRRTSYFRPWCSKQTPLEKSVCT